MSVHRKANGWTVRWREGASNRSRTFDHEREAKAFDKQLRLLRQQGELATELERRRVTVNDLRDEWLARRAPALSAKAAENYATQLDLRVLPEFGARRAHQITVADVERWIAALAARGDHPPTILKACTVLQALLTMAVKDGILTHNVVAQASKPPQRRERVPYLIKPLAVEQIRAQYAANGQERDLVLLELLAYAGLRPESEAVRLPWRHVRDRTILIVDTKRNRERTVQILDPLMETLNAWYLRLGRPGPDVLVVPNNAGNAWTANDWRLWQRRVFKPAAITAAGLPADVRARDLRGSLVSLLVHEGRSIVEVARQTGHSAEVCLRDYAQVFSDVDPSVRKSAAEIIRAARAQVAAEDSMEVDADAV